jgi:hypothetical protein
MKKLLTTYNSDDLLFTPEAIQQRPEIAALMATIIFQSTFIDALIIRFLTDILKLEAKPVIEIFTAITNDGAKTVALRKLAEIYLHPDLGDKFSSILKSYKKAIENRNLVAHHLWGISNTMPDVVIYTHPVEYVIRYTAMKVALLKGDNATAAKYMRQMPKMWSYDKEEFMKMADKLDKVRNRLLDFVNMDLAKHSAV